MRGGGVKHTHKLGLRFGSLSIQEGNEGGNSEQAEEGGTESKRKGSAGALVHMIKIGRRMVERMEEATNDMPRDTG